MTTVKVEQRIEIADWWDDDNVEWWCALC